MTQKSTSDFSSSESRQRQRVVDTLTRLMVTDRTITNAEMRFLKDMFQRLDDSQLQQVLHSWFPNERQAQAVYLEKRFHQYQQMYGGAGIC
ncbi:MAG: hypothetical protein CL923_07720 [Deltaproteobacteria bacterium]|jgi:hypothetical protein|nr:hypothetical protein [Deltaproteobacteria bacterium]MBQ32427.1 hypothetical protein [Deltaproteobacteria bacterium]MDP7158442.1 hypothetical protein [SAR324 cluster bacterium]MDP7317281.1 hypothetical protein [SAR324 cluster bacterium]|tara:strand:+ start:375 stop:647 length:273 start_codon:yes stop_codon:yes gene_type:complete